MRMMTTVSDPPMVSAVSPAVSGAGHYQIKAIQWIFIVGVDIDVDIDIDIDFPRIVLIIAMMTISITMMMAMLMTNMILFRPPVLGM